MAAPAGDVRLVIMLAAAVSGIMGSARGQPGLGGGQTASEVIARSGGDAWSSSGGVVGPWWSGSGNTVGPPTADGGFWFGLPGLGFGGSQGSQRNSGATGPGVTAMSGVPGTISSAGLVPFVTGVVPVVGYGFDPIPPAVRIPPPSVVMGTPLAAPAAASPPPVPAESFARFRSSSAAARKRSREAVEEGDLQLLRQPADRRAARKALAHYQLAARSADDDTDVHLRLAILHEALGRKAMADRAIDRALAIDGRLAVAPPPAQDLADGVGNASLPHAPAVASHGLRILEEISTRGGSSEPPAEAARGLDWLRTAWLARWAMSDGRREPR